MEISKNRCSAWFNSWATIFFVYTNICSNLSTNVKLFADDTSLFSMANGETDANDPCAISNWAYQWKVSLNQDRSKPAQEVIFSRNASIQWKCFNF